MRSEHESTRIVRSWLENGSTGLPDRVLDAVLSELPSTPQRRRLWLPWRNPQMSMFVKLAAGVAVIAVAVVVGITFLPGAGIGGPAATATPSPSPSPPIGGTVNFVDDDGGESNTVVEAVADGASVSGTAVSTLQNGVHTVQLECAARHGNTWAFAGKVKETTVPGEPAGAWSAVLVRDGSPQQIAVWLSEDPSVADDCSSWLGSLQLDSIGDENFVPVTSGSLVPPPDLGS